MKLMALLLLASIYGCSTPTGYEKSSGKEGYSDKSIDQNLKVADFKGNSSTKGDRAELFAKFRAIEVCQKEKNTLAHILTVKDKTTEKNVTQSTTSYPSYYYGASPYYGYGRYGGGVGMSYSVGSTQTWNETYTYPEFEVYFECTPTPKDARVSFKNLSSSQIKDFVKDLMGAVQVDNVLEDSPNKTRLKVGDIITHANGNRVGSILELYQSNRNSSSPRFKVDFFREGVKKSTDVAFLDVTEMVMHSQKEIIKEACKSNDLKKNSLCK